MIFHINTPQDLALIRVGHDWSDLAAAAADTGSIKEVDILNESKFSNLCY